MASYSSILAWKILCTDYNPLVDYSPWSHKESDTTERLSTHTPTSGAYLLMSIIASSLIDPFIVTQCPSLSFFISFVLESIWSHTNFVSPDFLSFPFYPTTMDGHIFESLLPAGRQMIPDRAMCPQHTKVSTRACGPLARAGCPSAPRSPQHPPHGSLVDVIMVTW